MTNTPSTLEAVPVAQLEVVIGGAGIGSQIGGMFGAEGAKWGGIADNILGMIGAGGGSAGGGAGGGDGG
jgi:hypothetical protein